MIDLPETLLCETRATAEPVPHWRRARRAPRRHFRLRIFCDVSAQAPFPVFLLHCQLSCATTVLRLAEWRDDAILSETSRDSATVRASVAMLDLSFTIGRLQYRIFHQTRFGSDARKRRRTERR